jgi:hypothetical protein
MKKVIIILALILSNVINAQTFFSIDTDTLSNQSYCCHKDTINFYDHSQGSILQWQWTLSGAVDTQITYTSFTQSIQGTWLQDGVYWITLETIDTNGNFNTASVCLYITTVKLNFDTVYLQNSINIIASSTTIGGSYFWYRNENLLNGWNIDDTILNVSDTGFYYVSLYPNNQCLSQSSVVVLPTITTDIITINSPSVKKLLYPNPANNYVNVSNNGITRIFDMNGKILLTSISTIKIDISSLPNGNYVVNTNGINQNLIVTH